MLAYVVAIAVAAAVVGLTDGSFARLTEVRFSRAWLLAAGLAIQILLNMVHIPKARLEDVGIALLLLSYVAVLGFVASNVKTRGMAIIGAGIALNAAVIALNLGMPYHVVDGIPRETTIKHRPERTNDVLPILSDRFAYGSPLRAAISIGDFVLFVGLVDFAYANSRRQSRRPARIPKHYVDLPALERERVIDPNEHQSADTSWVPTPAPTTLSSASRTRES